MTETASRPATEYQEDEILAEFVLTCRGLHGGFQNGNHVGFCPACALQVRQWIAAQNVVANESAALAALAAQIAPIVQEMRKYHDIAYGAEVHLVTEWADQLAAVVQQVGGPAT